MHECRRLQGLATRLTPFDGVEDLSDFFVHVLNAQWSWLWNARLTQPLLACATVAAKSAR